MKRICSHLSIWMLSAAALVAAPAPTSVQNPGSNFLPGLPGYGIAQGIGLHRLWLRPGQFNPDSSDDPAAADDPRRHFSNRHCGRHNRECADVVYVFRTDCLYPPFEHPDGYRHTDS